MTYAIAIVPDTVARYRWKGMRPRFSKRVGGWVKFVKFYIGCHPESELGSTGPAYLRSAVIRPIVVEFEFGHMIFSHV
jgi:hypothetical protein